MRGGGEKRHAAKTKGITIYLSTNYLPPSQLLMILANWKLASGRCIYIKRNKIKVINNIIN